MAWNNEFREWLTDTKALINAQQVVDFLYAEGKDWSKEAIAALIGNMRHESSLNPNMYEFGYDWSSDRGFGLVQWTPRSKYWDWGVSKGYTEAQLRSGEAQLARIDYEVENNIQYIANGHQRRYRNGEKYNFSFADFRSNKLKLSVNQLTEAFMWNYEGPNYSAGSNSLVQRQNFAVKAYNQLDWAKKGKPSPSPDDKVPETTPDKPTPGIDTDAFIKDLIDLIEKMLTVDVFKAGNSEYYQNAFIILSKQMANMYKIKPNSKFVSEIKKKFEDFNTGYIPIIGDDPEPDPDPDEPTNPGSKIFPVKKQKGINFFKRNNWGSGTLQRNMTYGVRSNGDNHFGYDIGGGGIKHTIYSITNGKVIMANFANGIGNRIRVQNADDKYFIQYGHLDSLMVKSGDTVRAGQPIGVMGNTGGNYSIHLDVKISTNSEGFHDWNTTIDPEKYLQVDKDNSTKLLEPSSQLIE